MKKDMNAKNYHINYDFISTPQPFGSSYLYQVGKMFCDRTTVIPSHTHVDWFELTVALSGKGTVYTNRERTPIEEGDILLSFPYDIHKIVSDPDAPLKFSFLSFRTEDEDVKKNFDEIFQTFYESDKRIFHDPAIAPLTEMLISEFSSPAYAQGALVAALLQAITVLTVRAFLYKQVSPISNHANPSEVLCHKVMRYIDSHLFAIENLTQVAAHFHHNYSYLSAKFKQTTKLTLTQYLTDKKLERAKLLIKEGKLSFTEIAALLRYASLYSFSKSFKLHFGISPREYQRLHRPTPQNKPIPKTKAE
ncbi:MAG: helix-turn-helix transcriptional regulator [Clostridia bacterium]|nr:helix-turn-helix transcriptional regulator [Clostridia bacterium]